jgi:nucleotide-binding universal stress UspA family protein
MNILVGYDGSKVAGDAIELAKKYLHAFDGKLHIVTSMQGGPQVPREDFDKAEKDLDFIKGSLKKQDIPCEIRLSVRGLEPGEDLVEYAKENKIDQIILGVRRRSKVGKLLFGSTAQFVILESPCPVLSVK